VILVVGGTGTLGRRVVARLVADGHRVRVLTRTEGRARHLPRGVEVVVGDLRHEPDVALAVAGSSTVISAVHGFDGADTSPEAIDRDANRRLMERARAAGANRFILMSVVGAHADHPMSLFRAKHAAEETLRGSGLRFTIVRATAFLETWLSVVGAPLDSGKALVFGPGTNPVNFVSVSDVAMLVAECVRDSSTVGETLEIGGPEDVGLLELAQRLIAARDVAARVSHVPLPALRLMAVLARPFAPAFARRARAAVFMSTADMTFSSTVRERFPAVPSTTLADVLRLRNVPPELAEVPLSLAP
jgi:NADH dehydrogenase